MEILLWVVAWILVGCGVALFIGAVASLSDVPVDQHSSHDAVGNIDYFRLGERAPENAVNEPNAVLATDWRRPRSIYRSDIN